MNIPGLLASCVILSLSAFTKNNVVKNIQQKQDSVVAKGAVLKKISDQFSFTEGASVDKQGNVFFTDQPNDKIYRWDASSEQITLFLQGTGRSNGMNSTNREILLHALICMVSYGRFDRMVRMKCWSR